jgi:uncharacterized protein
MMLASARRFTAGWILRRPLVAYLLLTFLIAWVFWVPLAVLFHGGWDLESLLANPLVIALQTAGVTAPLVSAFVVTRVSGGKGTARRLLEGLKRWRVGPWWYAAACLLVPVLTIVGLGVRAALGVEAVVPRGSTLAVMLTDIGWLGVVLTYPLQLLGQCFGSPLLEEPGWRGFALPRLQQRMPAAAAAVLVGAIWGLWHLPLFIALQEHLPVTLTLIILHGCWWCWATRRSAWPTTASRYLTRAPSKSR